MFYIRADANETIASGHIMRCMTIAAEIERLGEPCTFLCADQGPEKLLGERGFSFYCLNTPFDDPEQELEPLKAFLRSRQVKTLLVDSYYATERYLRELSRETAVIYLDDEARFPYPVHTVINYGVHYKNLPYDRQYAGTAVQLLLGGSYIPVREEFCFGGIPIKDRVKDVLLTTGGSDPCHMSAALAKRLPGPGREGGFRLHIVCGPFYDNREELLSQAGGEQVVLHENVKSMGELMRQADAAVCAGGTTLYELCACGVPAVCFTFADNQRPGALELCRLGAVDYAGDARDGTEAAADAAADKLMALCKSRELRESRSRRMRALVDGKGAQRLARYCVYGMLE